MNVIVRKPIQRLFDQSFDPRAPEKPRVHNKHRRTAPFNAVEIGRGTPWGNPYRIGIDGTRDEVIELYRVHVLPKLDVTSLRGKHLVCFCKPAACHGDLLLAAANT